MENATKALIIAAAILIAIVLISLGVYVLGIGQEAIKGADMTESEIATFNAKFTSYEGDHVMGSKINTLLQTVATNNLTEGTDGKQVSVTIDGADQGAITDAKNSRVPTGASYDVDWTPNATGLVETITITTNT